MAQNEPDFDFVYRMILNKSDELDEMYQKLDDDLVNRGILRKWADIPNDEKMSGEKKRRSITIKMYCPEFYQLSKDFDALQNEWRELLTDELEDVLVLPYYN
jgi:acyl carrier protein phosphodiesterase